MLKSQFSWLDNHCPSSIIIKIRLLTFTFPVYLDLSWTIFQPPAAMASLQCGPMHSNNSCDATTCVGGNAQWTATPKRCGTVDEEKLFDRGNTCCVGVLWAAKKENCQYSMALPVQTNPGTM